MATDNTILNSPTVPGGDVIRDISKGGAKTQVIVLDGGGAGAENIISAGQKTMVNSLPVAIASDYVPVLQQDLIGNINNYYPNKLWNFVLGQAINVSTTRVDMWLGPTTTYVFPVAPIQMQVVSTSASDTVGGTGMQTAHIHYLDNNYIEQLLPINLNGLTPVLTSVSNILRINGFHGATAGTTGAAVGTISLQAVGGAVTYSVIQPNYNFSRQAIFTIPAGKTGYINEWSAGGSTNNKTGNSTIIVDLRAKTHLGLVYSVFLPQDELYIINNTVPKQFKIPIVIPATVDFKVTCVSNDAANPATVGCRIAGWVE